MRQEHYQKAEGRNVTNGKAELTPSVCIVERKTRPPSQDHSTLKQSLDGKAGGGSMCVVTLLPEKYGYMGTEGWAFPVPSCKHTTGTPVLGCMRWEGVIQPMPAMPSPVPVSQQQKSPSRNHKGHVMGLRSQPSGTGERWGLPSLCDIWSLHLQTVCLLETPWDLGDTSIPFSCNLTTWDAEDPQKQMTYLRLRAGNQMALQSPFGEQSHAFSHCAVSLMALFILLKACISSTRCIQIAHKLRMHTQQPIFIFRK